MAPNGNTKPRRPGGSKPAHSSKPSVVPAIPLPYVKRQEAAAARASAASATTQEPDATPASELKLTNGNEVKKAESVASAAAASPVSSPVSTSAPKAEKEVPKTKADSHSKAKKDTAEPAKPNNSSATVAAVPKQATTSEKEDTHKNSAVSDHVDQSTTKNQTATGAQTSDKVPVEMNEKPNGIAGKGESKAQADNQQLPKMNKTRPPSAVPPGRYQLPPAFTPSGRPMGPTANGDMRGPRPPMPNGPPLHQPHPSNGSIHFGAFHGSTSSSPAPLSGGIAPPPGMPVPNGQPPYMAPGTNGFHMIGYGAEHVPVTTFDNYGRPTMAYGPMDSFPPFGNNFGPPTPHSYHDSQASGPPDDVSVYGQFASAPVRNGASGPVEDTQSPNHPGRMFGGPEYPPMMSNAGPPPHMMSPMDDAEGLVEYFRRQFGAPEFADCVLELRYANKQAPIHMPGHRIIFARSSELANAMSKGLPRHSMAPLPPFVLETDSKWIQSESFYFAIQRLYGLPLFDPSHGDPKQSAATDAGSLMERFDFALGYAASGHLLRWDPVTRRGCELAIQLLNLQTVEKALEFALEGHRDEGSYNVFKYGDGSRAILNEIISFIANNLHPNFKIDTSVTDPSNCSRLPQAAPTSNATTRKLSPPPIARGTSVHLGKGRRSQQISGIQFGDLSLTEGKMSPSSDASGASQQRTPLNALLSRVLLNLPFETLKALLENATNNGNAWPNADAVFRAVKDTVAERERRRFRLVQMVKSQQIPQWEIVSSQLSTPEPRNYIGPWGALGWQEEILPFGPSESPTLTRTWAPLTNSQTTTQAAYP
ncbi:hypothetical protein LB507_008769 [Fusarium sp. FIESC RH6]|nr:hypothetical protein LB507_008769 [Fusarium sp. FIESC RH6]